MKTATAVDDKATHANDNTPRISRGEREARKIIANWKSKGANVADAIDAASRLGLLVSGNLMKRDRAVFLREFHMKENKVDLDLHTSAIHVAFENGCATVVSGRAILEECEKRDKPGVRATQYKWTEPANIPRRDCLYGNHYYRKFMTETVGVGGGGKSLHAVVEALAMISGRSLLGHYPAVPLRVWYVNLEDPIEETQRRFAAAAIHYKIEPAVLEERLFIDSGRDQRFVVMQSDGRSPKIIEPVVASIIEQICENEIDVLIVDPFISTHEVDENDNTKMQQVAALFVRIADESECAVELIHHVNKAVGDGKGEVTADSGRGGGAIKDKARHVRALNGMSNEEAKVAGINPNDRFDYFRIGGGGSKVNLTRHSGHSDWRRMVSVSLDNGGKLYEPPDNVGVVTLWEWPSAVAVTDEVSPGALDAIKARIHGGNFKESDQANDWAGKVVAEVLGLELEEKGIKPAPVKAQIKQLLKAWITAGHFKVEARKDADRREPKKFIVVGSAQPYSGLGGQGSAG